jgi:hypothetical protein
MELSSPESENWVTPELAPKMVDEAVAVTVSLAAAKIEAEVCTVMELPPLDVSATAVAPLIVNAVSGADTTAGPLTVETPPPENTAKVVLELKKLLMTVVTPPVNCWATVPPLTVDPLMLKHPLGSRRAD